MIIRVTNIAGLFCLIYAWYVSKTWFLSVNEGNIISSIAFAIFPYVPSLLLFIVLLIIYLRVIYINKGVLSYIMYIFTLTLFQFLFKVSAHTLMLEDTTTFFLFKITNPIPLEWKMYHVNDVLLNMIETNPELLWNKLSIQELETFLINKLDINKIKMSNASQISEYLHQLFLDKVNGDVLQNHIVISTIKAVLIQLFIIKTICKWLCNL